METETEVSSIEFFRLRDEDTTAEMRLLPTGVLSRYITYLEGKYNDLDRVYLNALEANVTARQRHTQDVEVIGCRLLSEADDRGWCDQFDTVVESLNEELWEKLETRVREYSIEVSCTATLSMTVTASSAENAEEEAREHVRELEGRSAAEFTVDAIDIDSVSVES